LRISTSQETNPKHEANHKYSRVVGTPRLHGSEGWDRSSADKSRANTTKGRSSHISEENAAAECPAEKS